MSKKYSTGLASELRDMFNATTIEEARRLKESIYDEYKDVANESMVVLDEGLRIALQSWHCLQNIVLH